MHVPVSFCRFQREKATDENFSTDLLPASMREHTTMLENEQGFGDTGLLC